MLLTPMKTKIENSASGSFLYTLIRIYPHEFSRVFISWAFRFLYRFALVLAWTFLVSFFIEQLGHERLSYLFLFHALLVIGGSLLFIRLSKKYSLEMLFLITILSASSLLIASQFLFRDSFWLLVGLFFVEAFILIQLSINFDTFIERLFTPLESERTFPVIESADTLAGLFAGFFLFFSADLGLFTLLWILIGVLFALVPVLLFYQNFIRLTPGMCMYRKQLISGFAEESSIFGKSYHATKRHDFTRGLACIVFVQWITALFLEFLFTVSVSQKALESLPATVSGVENILIHEFGFLYILFGAVAFISQIFLAPRVITYLGIVPSMMVHPLLFLLSLIGLLGSFGFFTTVLTRLNAEITGGIYRNAYQSSYYVFEEEESQHVRLFLEGIVRPLGVLAATLYLLFGRFFVPKQFFTLSVLFGMFLSVLVFLFLTSRLQKKYFQTAISQLFSPDVSENLKLHLLEIVHQKGNEEARPVLYKILSDVKTPVLLKLKILELFSDDPEILPVLFEYVSSADHDLRLSSLMILKKFAANGYFSSERYFSRNFLFQTLKTRYVTETHDAMRLLLLEILALCSGKEVVDFFTSEIEQASGNSLAQILLSCRFFDDEGISSLLRQFLSSQDPRVWASACIALRGEHLQTQISASLWKHLRDDAEASNIAAMSVIRALHAEEFTAFLQKKKYDDGSQAVFFQTVTLAFLGEHDALERFIGLLTGTDIDLAEKAYSFLAEFSEDLRSSIEQRVHFSVSHAFHQFLRQSPAGKLHNLPFEELRMLRNFYMLLNASEEVFHLDHLITLKSRRL